MRKKVEKKSVLTSRTVTNTHLVVSVIAMLAAGGAALATLVSAATVNTVRLQAGQACRQAGEYGYNRSFSGVEIVNTSNGSVKSRLINGCRDAGYGLRKYAFTCNSNPSTYTVAWTECSSAEVLMPQVQVSLDSSSPASKLVTPVSATTTLAIFTLTASVADANVRSIVFTPLVANDVQGSLNDYSIFTLEDEEGHVLNYPLPAKGPAKGGVVMAYFDSNFPALVLRAGITKRVYLRARFAPGAIGGRLVGFKIAAPSDVVANGIASGVAARVTLASASINGNPHYVYKGIPTIEVLPLNNMLVNGQNDLFKFKVTAVGSDVDVHKLSFDVATTTASLRSVRLVDVTESREVALSGTRASQWSQVPGAQLWNINTVINPVRTVSVGTSRTFVLRGEVTGVGIGSAVATRLGGDNSLPTVGGYGTTAMMLPVDVLDTDVNNDFIWSDRSATGHNVSTTDWINGYVVQGLKAPKSTPTVVAR